VNIDAAIVGIGCSKFGRGLPDSQLRLAAVAFKDALADAGLQRSDVDGLSIHGCTGASSPTRFSTRRLRFLPASPAWSHA